MDELTEEEKGLIATAILHIQRPGFPPKAEHLPACERLVDRGWLDRKLIAGYVTFRLSDRGVTALELGVPLAEAWEATN